MSEHNANQSARKLQTPEDLADYLDGHLTAVDQYLAHQGMRLADRPFHATVTLVRERLLDVSTDGGNTTYEPNDSCEFIVLPWFRSLYRSVEAWYEGRSGSALGLPSDTYITGVLLFRATPFALRILPTLTRPGDSAGTVWVSWPGHVEEHEVVTQWLVTPPNLSRLTETELATVEHAIRDIAGGLRFVRTSLLGAKSSGDAFLSFAHGVLRRAPGA